MSNRDVMQLFAARRGHFRFESGHHGDLWLDIPPAYLRPKRLRPYALELARLLETHHLDGICGPLVEGAFVAQMIAEELDCEFYYAEQFARPGAGLFPIGYKIPEALRDAVRGKRIAIVDDVINAGSAVTGAYEDLIDCGAVIMALGALMVLGPPAPSFAASRGIALVALSQVEENALWEPASCPLCIAGVRLDATSDSPSQF